MTNPVLPRPLAPGDLIGIFSPSEPLTSDRQLRMRPSLQLLQEHFRYRFARNALAESSYTAGSVPERLDDIGELLADPAVKGLLASWGGKSANQLVLQLPYDTIVAARKPIIGFSDACVVLNAITALTGLITFSGPNVAGKLQESDHRSMQLICGRAVPPFGHTARENWTTITAGGAQGTLFGGNLSTFTLGLAGSRAMNAMADVVFFWESASEPPQIIDQYLTCLENCGFLDRVVAMIVGDVSYMEEPRKERSIDDLIGSYARRLGFPSVRVQTFGHHKMENPVVPIGSTVVLDTVAASIHLQHQVVADAE